MRIPLHAPVIGEQAWAYVRSCLESGWVSARGPFVQQFEERFAAYLGLPYAVATQSGTAALHLALAACGIGPGDEVIVPALTYIATANVVVYVGATPVFVDVDGEAGVLDPQLVAGAITPRTRAIIPVHVHGHPAPMEALSTLARQHGLALIEDAAGALGARCRDAPVGTLGDIGCFSFYANKVITTGGGGMLVTRDAAIAARARCLANHAQAGPGDYQHHAIGFNYRLTALQAALGLAQLEQLDAFLERKRRHARQYDTLLAATPGIRRPAVAPWATHSYGMYTIRLTDTYPCSAAVLRRRLEHQGIETRAHFVPLPDLPPYRQPSGAPIPNARRISASSLSLPIGVDLEPAQLVAVAAALRASGAGG